MTPGHERRVAALIVAVVVWLARSPAAVPVLVKRLRAHGVHFVTVADHLR
jgi:DNA invertase Pin-like site-specific DNA recombinase